MPITAYLDLIKTQLGVDPANKFFYSQYFDSLAIFALFFILSKLVILVSTKIILKLTKHTKTDIDDLIIGKINKPISLILILIGIRLAMLPVGLKQTHLDIIEHILTSLIIVIITYIAIAIIDILIDGWGRKVAAKTKSTFDDELIPIFHKFSRIFLGMLGLLFILPVWGVQIGPLLTSLGIAGIAIAFALQNTLGNIFGGVSILADKSVKVGDKIKLDNETMGQVMEVGLRSTKIRTWDNEVVTVPNGKLAEARILNFIQPDPSVRIVVEFGVEYGSDTEKVKKVVLETLDKMPQVLKEPAPKVQMTEMADFALKFRTLFWVGNYDIKFDTKALATEKIYNALIKSGIGIPFPTRTVYLKNSK